MHTWFNTIHAMKDLEYTASNVFRFLMHRASQCTLNRQKLPCNYNAIVRTTLNGGLYDYIPFNSKYCMLAYNDNANKIWDVQNGKSLVINNKPMSKTCPWWSRHKYAINSIEDEYKLSKDFIEEIYGQVLDNCFKLAQQYDIWLYYNTTAKWKLINIGESIDTCLVEMDMQQLVEYPWTNL